MIYFTIPGEPQGKGRARTFFHKNAKKIVSMTPEKTVSYENLIKTEAYEEMTALLCGVVIGPVEMRLKAFYSIPKSETKKRRELMLNGDIRPTKKPDADNVLKVVADALNKIVYHDDTQIVRVSVEKWYSDTPRVEVEIEEWRGKSESMGTY